MQKETRLMVPESEFEMINKIYIALEANDYLYASQLFLVWNRIIRDKQFYGDPSLPVKTH